MSTQPKARVFQNGRSQAVQIPAKYCFNTSEVYLEHNPETGTLTLSEKPTEKFRSERWAEIFQKFDEAGGADFILGRDMSPAPKRDLF